MTCTEEDVSGGNREGIPRAQAAKLLETQTNALVRDIASLILITRSPSDDEDDEEGHTPNHHKPEATTATGKTVTPLPLNKEVSTMFVDAKHGFGLGWVWSWDACYVVVTCSDHNCIDMWSPDTLYTQTLPVLTADVHSLWTRRLPLCIEVRGQARGSCDSTLLLEQWNIKVISKR